MKTKKLICAAGTAVFLSLFTAWFFTFVCQAHGQGKPQDLAQGVTYTPLVITPAAPSALTASTSLLKSTVPALDPRPENTAAQFTTEWWIADAKIREWQAKYPEPVLVVTPAAVDRPVFSFTGDGSATAFIVLPRYGLLAYEAAIKRGDVKWCLLADAFVAINGGGSAAPPDTASAEALQRYRAAVAKAIETLSALQ